MEKAFGPRRVLSSSRIGSPIHSPMKGEGFLRFVCMLLLATGATSCRIEVEGAKPAQKTQESGRAVDVRQLAPLEGSREEPRPGIGSSGNL